MVERRTNLLWYATNSRQNNVDSIFFPGPLVSSAGPLVTSTLRMYQPLTDLSRHQDTGLGPLFPPRELPFTSRSSRVQSALRVHVWSRSFLLLFDPRSGRFGAAGRLLQYVGIACSSTPRVDDTAHVEDHSASEGSLVARQRGHSKAGGALASEFSAAPSVCGE